MKTLLVVSGGDAPGINTALASYVGLAALNQDHVVGSLGGFAGALEKNFVSLSPAMLIPWISQSGSVIPSSRDPVLSHSDADEKLIQALAAHQIDNMVLFGGDGSLRYLPPLLQQWGIPFVGIPTTIDNNVAGTELTLGFDSACNFAYPVIDGIRATAHALPGRIFMLETLGGDCGNLALEIAFGAGAHAVLVPEYPYENEWLGRRLAQAVELEGYGLLVICEGVSTSRTLAEVLAQETNIRVRDTRLGHAQRGAAPSHRDRALANQMARTAYEALKNGIRAGVVVVRQGQVTLHEGLLTGTLAPPDRTRYEIINHL
jgi:6-phosphofructokinase 1